MRRKLTQFKLTLLTLLMLVGASFTASAYDFEEDGIYYNITGSATCEVTSRPSGYMVSVEIPSLAGGYRVTAIGESAFAGSTAYQVTLPVTITTIRDYAFCSCMVDNIVMKEGVTTIGKYAFGKNEVIESIKIPNSVTSMDTYAFAECTNLSSVTWGTGLKRIPNCTFYKCSNLTSFQVPSWVTSIGSYAFEESGLQSITFSSSGNLSTIGEYAFFNCKQLTSVTLPNTVTTMGSDVFNHCTALSSVTWSTGVTTIPNYTFYFCSNLVNFKFPYWIKTIDNFAFTGSGLKQAILPYGLTTINSSFYNCPDLETVLIPSSVTTVSNNSFTNCPSLTTLYCNMATPPSMEFSSVPSNCKLYVPVGKVPSYKGTSGWSSRESYVEAGAYDYNYGVEGYYANSYYHMTITSNTPVTVGGVTYAGTAKYVFHPNIKSISGFTPGLYETDYMCGSGKKYIITEIGDSCFHHSSANATSVDFTNCTSLTTLGHDAFWASNFATVKLPASVTTYKSYALYYMPKLTDLYVANTTPVSIPNNCFYEADQKRAALHVTTSSAVTAYKAAGVWKRFYDITTDLATTGYNVWVCGMPVTKGNYNDITSPYITGEVEYYPSLNEVVLNNARLRANGNEPAVRFNTAGQATVYFEGTNNQIGSSGERVYVGIQSDNSSIKIEGVTYDHADSKIEVYANEQVIYTLGSEGQTVTTRLADGIFYLNSSGRATIYSPTNTNSTLQFANCDIESSSPSTYYPIYGYDCMTMTDCHISQPLGATWKDASECGYNCGYLYGSDGDRITGNYTISCGDALRGDVDNNGEVDVSDVSTLIDSLLTGNATPGNADVNNDGTVDVSDVADLLDYLLTGVWPSSLMAPASTKDSTPKCKIEMPVQAPKGEILDVDMPEKVAPVEEGHTTVLADDKAI